MITETVPEAFDGERLDRFVSLVAGCSRSESARAIADGDVTVNGRTQTTRSHSLTAGDTVATEVVIGAVAVHPAADETVAVEVVHVDEHLIVVDKQPGLVVHPGAGNPDGTLVNGLLARFPELESVGEPHRPGIVHRLDIGTSGLMLVARTSLAYDELVAAMGARRVNRRYLAVVWGLMEAEAGLVDGPLGRSNRDPRRIAVMADGREARTRYEVGRRAVDAGVTVVHCELETGRTHQIRVHLASIGHPVVGDERYGRHRDTLPFGRPALHAAELELAHPATGEPLHFTAPPPPDLADLLSRF